jgi:hypothetical protein
MDDGVRANPLTPKSRKKLPNKAMHLIRAGMFLMPVISLVHQLLRPGDGQRCSCRPMEQVLFLTTRTNHENLSLIKLPVYAQVPVSP